MAMHDMFVGVVESQAIALLIIDTQEEPTTIKYFEETLYFFEKLFFRFDFCLKSLFTKSQNYI